MDNTKLYDRLPFRIALAILLLASFFVIALVATGCQDKEGNTIQSPTEPPMPAPPIMLHLGGSCSAAVSSINCCDDSEPSADITNVSWTLFRGVADALETKNSEPHDCVSFGPGLVFDTYAVEQTVTASDGTTRSKTYSNVTVGGL